LDEVALQQIETQGISEAYEKQFFHRQGHRVNGLLRCAAIAENTCIAFVLDINRQKQWQAELERAKHAAEDANIRKSQFLANMSHELRTPLNAVIGYSEMLLAGMARTPEKQQQFARNIATSGRHLLDMVNDILDIAKVEAGKMTLAMETVVVGDLLQTVEEMFAETARTRGLTLHFNLAPNLTTIEADPVRLRQILLNLVSNAVKFNRPGGRVSVHLYTETEASGNLHWLLGHVADTGIGIPKEKLACLFSEFYQVDSSLARQYEGTGLGLALTRKLVALHGGSIHVTSQEGIGTTFTFKLPLQQTHPLNQAAVMANGVRRLPASPAGWGEYPARAAQDELRLQSAPQAH
jgi:signal transduction histidine kinase